MLSAMGAHAALTLVAREPFAGPGTVTLMATQAANGNYAPVSQVERVTVVALSVDTPTLPPAALLLLGALLAFAAMRQLRNATLSD